MDDEARLRRNMAGLESPADDQSERLEYGVGIKDVGYVASGKPAPRAENISARAAIPVPLAPTRWIGGH